MELSERKKQILKEIIESYIETAEPIGSKTLSGNLHPGVSPATIRNEMSELEELGLLEKPHTSSGRVPSPLGYRMYVDHLMRHYQLTLSEIDEMSQALRQKIKKLDRLIMEVGALLSDYTSYTSLTAHTFREAPVLKRLDIVLMQPCVYVVLAVLGSGMVKNRLARTPEPVSDEDVAALSAWLNECLSDRRLCEAALAKLRLSHTQVRASAFLLQQILDFLKEISSEITHQEMYLGGIAKMLYHPEYRDGSKAQPLLEFLSDEENVRHLPFDENTRAVKICIGPENEAEPLKGASMLYTTYKLGEDMHGIIGVVGPIRMNYPRAYTHLSLFARGLTRFLKEESGEDEPV